MKEDIAEGDDSKSEQLSSEDSKGSRPASESHSPEPISHPIEQVINTYIGNLRDIAQTAQNVIPHLSISIRFIRPASKG